VLSRPSSGASRLAAAAALVGLMALAPVAEAKKVKVGGRVSITIPDFNPETGQSLASGRVKAKKGCDGLRVLRFAYFNADGTPVSTTLTSVVTDPKGRYLVALPPPFGDYPPYTLRIFVEPRKTTFRGRKVNCKVIRKTAPVPAYPSL
jgi:hypothetical protein